MKIIQCMILGLVIILAFGQQGQTAPTKNASVHARVLASGTLRCGFFEETPFTMVDPNTGERRGIAVELTRRIAEELNLKVEWIPVSNFTTLNEDLRQGKYDAICASVFNLSRAGNIDYTMPYAYAPVRPYARTERKASLPAFADIDWKTTTLAGMDGEGATTVARRRLPDAHFSILPEVASISDMLAQVATGKADIALVVPTVFAEYDRHNPGTLVPVDTDRAFHVFPVSFALKLDEAALKNTLDIVIRNMAASGEMEALITKYDPERLLYRPAPGYEEK